jgi:hypothetical protein
LNNSLAVRLENLSSEARPESTFQLEAHHENSLSIVQLETQPVNSLPTNSPIIDGYLYGTLKKRSNNFVSTVF